MLLVMRTSAPVRTAGFEMSIVNAVVVAGSLVNTFKYQAKQ